MKTIEEEVRDIHFCDTCHNMLAGRCLINGIRQPWHARACTNHYKPTHTEDHDDTGTADQ